MSHLVYRKEAHGKYPAITCASDDTVVTLRTITEASARPAPILPQARPASASAAQPAASAADVSSQRARGPSAQTGGAPLLQLREQSGAGSSRQLNADSAAVAAPGVGPQKKRPTSPLQGNGDIADAATPPSSEGRPPDTPVTGSSMSVIPETQPLSSQAVTQQQRQQQEGAAGGHQRCQPEADESQIETQPALQFAPELPAPSMEHGACDAPSQPQSQGQSQSQSERPSQQTASQPAASSQQPSSQKRKGTGLTKEQYGNLQAQLMQHRGFEAEDARRALNSSMKEGVKYDDMLEDATKRCKKLLRSQK